FTASGGKGAEPGDAAPDTRPAWARQLSARQRLSQADTLAAHTLRDGDRAMPGAAPDLKQSED
ncbi:MAG: P-type conjugative transfer protein TrbL, partial [Alphaproteobacteria bacterium]|nr:P-type conjugative transfer protein TrbL [Alphaproteobacteria bacterium]